MKKHIGITPVAAIMLSAAAVQAEVVYRAGFNEQLDHINTTTYSIDLSVPLDDQIYSLATQPGTNTLFGVTDAVGGDGLVTVDPVTGAFTSVVQMLDPLDPAPFFSSITFTPDGSLYAIATRDTSWVPGSILEVDMVTGDLTDTGWTSGGVGGQALEFNPDDGLFYHFYNTGGAGGGDTLLETVDPITEIVTPVPISGYDLNVVNALAYAGDGKFYAYDNTTGDLLEITTAGEVSLLNAFGVNGTFIGHGLALPVYVPEPGALGLLVIGGLPAIRRR